MHWFTRTFVFLWFFIGGVAHFVADDLFVMVVPPAIPWPLAVVYISGVFELLGAFGLLVARTRYAAALGLILLTIAVTPANVYMLQHAENFPNIPHAVLVWRLPFQVLLMIMIAHAGGIIGKRSQRRARP